LAKKNLIEHMLKSTAAEDKALEERFAKADSVLLRGPATAPIPEHAASLSPAAGFVASAKPPVPKPVRKSALKAPESARAPFGDTSWDKGIKEGFTLPSDEHQWLNAAVKSARMSGLTETTRSQVIRAGIAHLRTLTPTQLEKALEGVQRLPLGRRPSTKG
jgi:hypothetical protein